MNSSLSLSEQQKKLDNERTQLKKEENEINSDRINLGKDKPKISKEELKKKETNLSDRKKKLDERMKKLRNDQTILQQRFREQKETRRSKSPQNKRSKSPPKKGRQESPKKKGQIASPQNKGQVASPQNKGQTTLSQNKDKITSQTDDKNQEQQTIATLGTEAEYLDTTDDDSDKLVKEVSENIKISDDLNKELVDIVELIKNVPNDIVENTTFQIGTNEYNVYCLIDKIAGTSKIDSKKCENLNKILKEDDNKIHINIDFVNDENKKNDKDTFQQLYMLAILCENIIKKKNFIPSNIKDAQLKFATFTKNLISDTAFYLNTMFNNKIIYNEEGHKIGLDLYNKLLEVITVESKDITQIQKLKDVYNQYMDAVKKNLSKYREILDVIKTQPDAIKETETQQALGDIQNLVTDLGKRIEILGKQFEELNEQNRKFEQTNK
jgi:hypothetical protein